MENILSFSLIIAHLYRGFPHYDGQDWVAGPASTLMCHIGHPRTFLSFSHDVAAWNKLSPQPTDYMTFPACFHLLPIFIHYEIPKISNLVWACHVLLSFASCVCLLHPNNCWCNSACTNYISSLPDIPFIPFTPLHSKPQLQIIVVMILPLCGPRQPFRLDMLVFQCAQHPATFPPHNPAQENSYN